MITKVTHLTLLVKNQQEACVFYTEKLGFKVHTDEQFGEMRWLTLRTAHEPNFEIALMPPQNSFEESLIGKQGGSKPLFCVESNDCHKDVRELAQKGVKMLEEPKEESWGISASFQDLYGNLIYMCQPHK